MSDWLVRAKPRPQAAHVLLLCHHAGGFAYSYLPWVDAFGDDWEVLILELPGRGLHRKAEPVKGWDDLSGRVLPELQSVVGGRRLHIFGHSFGGYVAHKLATSLEKSGMPLGAVGISAIGPYAAEGLRDPQQIEEFMTKMEDPAYLPDSIRNHKAALQLYRHHLQSDVHLLRAFPMDYRLKSPVLIAGAYDDRLVHPTVLKAWLDFYPKADFRLFPGDHFYWRDQLPAIKDWFADQLLKN